MCVFSDIGARSQVDGPRGEQVAKKKKESPCHGWKPILFYSVDGRELLVVIV